MYRLHEITKNDVYTGTGLRQRSEGISKNLVKLDEIIDEFIKLLLKNMLEILINFIWRNNCTANKIVGIFRLHPCFRFTLRKPRLQDLLMVHCLFKNQF